MILAKINSLLFTMLAQAEGAESTLAETGGDNAVMYITALAALIAGGYFGVKVLGPSLKIKSGAWGMMVGFLAFGATFIGFGLVAEPTNNSAVNFGIFCGVIALTYMVSRIMTERLRNDEQTPRVTTVLAVFVFSLLYLYQVFDKEMYKFGVDLSGGVNLIYSIETQDGEEIGSSNIEGLIEALGRRLNPSGAKDIILRQYGSNEVEIIIPKAENSEVEEVKRTIAATGALKFNIVADLSTHADLVQQANLPENAGVRELVNEFDEVVGRWHPVARDREADPASGLRKIKYMPAGDLVRNAVTKEPITLPGSLADEAEVTQYLSENGIDDIEVLMVVDPEIQVEGEHLSSVSPGVDETLSPAVNFSMTSAGSGLFGRLTVSNVNEKLGIVLDDYLLSAPNINSQITDRGIIQGNFTQQEVDFTVGILRAGRLPSTLSKQPISENRMGSALGEVTVTKGVNAIKYSGIGVLIFIVLWYRWTPGVIAAMALAINVVLIVDLMAMIGAAYTLPGMAGLVLTVGMAVDANVLIFERIREELKGGAALRQAVRNGFGRATVTIVDANLTTLITAILLYAIGTDQIRGFAITLILGIIVSMFTAIFCARTVFELLMAAGRMKKPFTEAIHNVIDFMSIRKIMAVVSVILIATGLVITTQEGRRMLDIDLSGGASVIFPVKDVNAEANALEDNIADVIDGDPKYEGTLHTLTSVELGLTAEQKAWRLDLAFDTNQNTTDETNNADKVREFVQQAFGDNLVNKTITISDQVALNVPAPESADEVSEGSAEDTTSEDSAEDAGEASDCGQEEPEVDAEPAADEVGDAATPDETDETNDSESTDVSGSTDDAADDAFETGVEDSEAEPAQQQYQFSVAFGLDVTAGEEDARVDYETLLDAVKEAAPQLSDQQIDLRFELKTGDDASFQVVDTQEEETRGYSKWQVTVATDEASGQQIAEGIKNSPLFAGAHFHSVTTIGGQIASDMQRLATLAIVFSLVGIIGYLWLRFQHVMFGIAAVIALVHDVLITLGAIAITHHFSAEFLLIEEFRISLPVIAAFLTIIGYALNDTIVVFDRIREIRGKNSDLTPEMLNRSISSTLRRTLLTSVTTLIVVLLLYVFGGSGIHGFAFALVIGVVVGTYSSIFIASPSLLVLHKWASKKA